MTAPLDDPPGIESPLSGGRTRRLLLCLVAAVIVMGTGLGTLLAACSGGADDTVTTTLSAPPTSIVVVSTGTTSGPATSSTVPGEPTTPTTSAGPNGWQPVSTSLEELAAHLAQRLPEGQNLDLPDRLPAGWSLAMPGQVYGDVAAGYFADIAENPTVATGEGPGGPFAEYRVVFTDGKELAGLLVVIGDWGETEFQEVTAYGKTLYVYEDENLVVALVPGWDLGTVVGTPGAREAVLEIAASIKSW